MRFLCIIFFLLYIGLSETIAVPDVCDVKIVVRDSVNKEPLFLSTVALVQNGKQVFAASCDVSGVAVLKNIPVGNYKLYVTFIGYKSYRTELHLVKNLNKEVYLAPNVFSMQEVIVTAKEVKGITSSSVINRKAMEHLQPSSFSDLLELLPGGRSRDPMLTQVNTMHLREAGGGVSSSDFNIASKGIAFTVDGAFINTGADMFYLTGEASYDHSRRSTLEKGVDMRSISTDAIEQVEIIRGIPSVEYGSLTSGLVNIRRKSGGSDWHARLKVDGSSKLVYLGKGIELPERKIKLNVDVDWLGAKADPRNNLENYKRLTFSFRLAKRWETAKNMLSYNGSVDYAGSFNTDKIDPDINHDRTDSYKSRVNRLGLISNFRMQSRQENSFFKSFALFSSVNFSKDRMEEVRFCSLFRPMIAPNSTEAGEHDGVFLPFQFIGSQEVDNRPFGANVRMTAFFKMYTGVLRHDLKAGLNWQMDKNYGDGQIYDPLRPSNYTSITSRPRPYRDIPAGHDMALFAEDYLHLPLGGNTLELQAGVRVNTQLNLPSSYKLHNKFYVDPRLNVRWIFPLCSVGKKDVAFEVGGGVGWHSMQPSLSQFYPNLVYDDIIQLNYYHNNPDCRRVQMITYIFDPTNRDLDIARNFKWEIRGSVSCAGNDLSVTYFKEEMSSGFRTGTVVKPLLYKSYDSNSIDPDKIQGPPALEDLTYGQDTLLRVYGINTNGTRLDKSGVEFQFSSKRIRALATRITISGAYLRTVYSNSEGFYSKSNKVIDNNPIPYVGWYEEPDGLIRRSFNTNFMFDTYLEKLKLLFSFSAQCHWFSDQQTERKSGVPVYYVDKQGNKYAYTEQSAEDMYLQWLKVPYNEVLFERSKLEHFNLNVNLKVTKRLYQDRINLALFVNRLLSIYPDYHRNGTRIRQIGRSPYFGMELNFNI